MLLCSFVTNYCTISMCDSATKPLIMNTTIVKMIAPPKGIMIHPVILQQMTKQLRDLALR